MKSISVFDGRVNIRIVYVRIILVVPIYSYIGFDDRGKEVTILFSKQGSNSNIDSIPREHSSVIASYR